MNVCMLVYGALTDDALTDSKLTKGALTNDAFIFGTY